jgi:hypothetical protein
MCTVTSDIGSTGNQFETAQSTQYMPTLDQVVADAVHTNEPFKSFETGVIPFTGDVAMGTPGSNLAHRGPNDFLPPKRDPKDIFDTLFSAGLPVQPGAGGGSTGVPSDIQFRTRHSVLDAVLEDANRLKQTLGAADSRRIDSHMEGIRALELRIPNGMGNGGTGGMGSTGGCTVPEAPPQTLADMTAQSQAINRLIVAMLACNLTRVYTHLWSGARSDSTYPTIQINGAHHAYTHGSNGQEPRAIEKYIMSQYADLAKVMKATPMGAGTVLDNTLCYGVSDVAEPGGHVMRDWFIVLMGHAGGQLPGNRHVRLVGRKVTELQLTMQQMMGMNVQTWGTWDRTSSTVPEILT